MNSFVITIDIGNTNEKCALFKEQKLVDFFPFSEIDQIKQKFQLNPQNCVIGVVSVKDYNFSDEFPVFKVCDYFKERQFLNMPVHYSETLGHDRLVLAHYIWTAKENLPAITIDTGTFSTVDIITPEGLQGGYIIPGLELLRQSYSRGKNLFVPNTTEWAESFPQTTEEAMAQGALLSFKAPIENIITSFNYKVILTGGNGEVLRQLLTKHAASIHFDSNLIHRSVFNFVTIAQEL